MPDDTPDRYTFSPMSMNSGLMLASALAALLVSNVARKTRDHGKTIRHSFFSLFFFSLAGRPHAHNGAHCTNNDARATRAHCAPSTGTTKCDALAAFRTSSVARAISGPMPSPMATVTGWAPEDDDDALRWGRPRGMERLRQAARASICTGGRESAAGLEPP